MKKEGKKKKIKNSHSNEKNHFIKLGRPNFKAYRTVGQKASDFLTKWAGSWYFILGFSIFLVLWIILNTSWIILGKKWDPKPFILLNLILSCLAAIQAPIILMSQNRQSQKDRLKLEYDYAINRKAEKEIREIKNMLINGKKKK
ncbi:DUF1003 domain-containing protein [Candidatus Pacearchaeota archaeon]|nr:DUF1003 domain-containing protein [Candidatus Pacearchaeota archaeon]